MSLDEEKSVFCCRTCLSECFEYKYLHRRGLICEEITTLSDLLNFCTNLEFPENEENMPEQICTLCIKTLIKAVKFKKMVVENDKYLRKLASPFSKVEFSKVNEDDKNKDEMKEQENVEENVVSEMEVESTKLQTGKIEFITNELEHGNEFVALQYIHDGDVIESESLESQESGNSVAHIIPEEHGQYELQYIDQDNEIDIVVDDMLDDELQESIVEEYEDEENLEQASSESDIQQYIKEESESADSFSISVENDDSLQAVKHFIFSKNYVQKHCIADNEIIICDETDFANKVNLSKEKNPKFQCKICGKQLSNAGSFKYHMQLHSDKTPFLCSLCGEGFKTKNAYEGHLSTHNPNNPNTCDICGKSYRQAASLRAHMVVHTGEKPFQCEICGKGLTQKSGYKKHLLTHKNEKPYSCDICGRDFRYSSNLLSHKRTHDTSKRIFKCSLCSKSFGSMDQLRRHKQSHASALHFQCPSCPKRFKTLDSMETHRASDHSLFDTKVSRSNIVEML